MKPKVVFLLRRVLFMVSFLLLCALLIFLLSLLLFLFQKMGFRFLPFYGRWGIFVLLKSFPWGFALFLLGGVLFSVFILSRHTNVYRYPVVYSLIAIFILVLIFGFLVYKTPFHFELNKRALMKNNGLFFQSLYTPACPREIHTGTIEEKIEEGFKIRENGKVLTVLTSDLRKNKDQFEVGDEVVVIGEQEGDVIRAFGIHGVGERFKNIHREPRGVEGAHSFPGGPSQRRMK